MKQTKVKTIKEVKSWAIIDEDNNYFFCQDIDDQGIGSFPYAIFDNQKEAERYLTYLISGFKIVPVLITPLNKPKKKR